MDARDARLQWRETAKRRVAACPIFAVYAAERMSTDGRRGEFWLLETPDWVNVVPVLRGPNGVERFIMVRQYRHGSGSITTEFPAGVVERGEEPAVAAARELREETGYRAGRLVSLGRVRPNPAFMDNWCHTFLAEELALDGAPSPDALEELEAITVPAAEVDERMGAGEYVNALAVVALALYRRHRRGAGA